MINTLEQKHYLEEIINGNAKFDKGYQIWFSKLGDSTWYFTSKDDPLYLGETSSAFAWNDYIYGHGYTFGHYNSKRNNKFTYCLTEEIVEDLKIATVIYAVNPEVIANARLKKKILDPKTVKGRVDVLAKFFSTVIQFYKSQYNQQIKHLSEITFEAVKSCISSYPGSGAHLKAALKLISDPTIQKNLSSPLQWTIFDINSQSIRWPATVLKGPIPTLTDDQFTFLMSYCRKKILEFKQALGLAIHDCDSNMEFNFKSGIHKEAVDFYYEKAKRNKPYDSRTFLKNFKIRVGEIKRLLYEAQSASIMTILLLTGMRDTETKYLMTGCLENNHGYWFLKSKVVKHRPKDTPIAEGWLAIDLVIDAYDILQFFCNKTDNNYLFSTPLWIKNKKRITGYSGSSVNDKLQRFIKHIDQYKLFHGWQFSMHQCRETLVYQLARQEVGIPFISMQLKHFHSKFNRMPNQVTAGYGNYRRELLSGIAARKPLAKENALLEVYGENSKFAGGGAEAHKTRIDAFFKGMGLYGKDRENYIRKMAISGAKLMPTSIGSCTKNFTETKEGDLPPPCYGDYQCDPDCSNHVISKSGANVLKTRSELAKRQAAHETNDKFKIIWLGLAEKLDKHASKLNSTSRK